jgi:aryl-alcohol dehydrogenase-like predicted oxidoreductase
MPRIPQTDLEVSPLCLGGNVFGWTADEPQSFGVLDGYLAAGGNFIDTADVYSAWVPGHTGGESETIIGRWMATRGVRSRIVIATKVGMSPGLKGLSPRTIRTAAEASLRRLGVASIDLYYAHADDPETPLEDSLRAFDALVREGKVRYIGASNFTASRFAEALSTSDRNGLARYVALQPHYNLMHRGDFEGALADLCTRETVGCVPYYGLAKGFLTGKYRPDRQVDSPRAAAARAYLDARGLNVLDALDDISAAHHTTVAAVSLAWLRAQPAVIAPIASARTPTQLSELLPVTDLSLSREEVKRLSAASSYADG